MSKPFVEPVAVAPFLVWVDRQIAQLERAGETGATAQVLAMLGWTDDAGERRLSRWRVDNIGGFVERAVVEDALHHAGALWGDVYPDDDVEVRERWCPSCRQMGAAGDDDRCLWCDSETLAQRPRRRGGKPAGKYGRLSDTQLRALHRVYMEQDVSANALAKRIYAKAGYRSANSASRAIYEGWRRLGLPRRDRLEAVRLACTTHGLAPKHGPRPGYGTYKRRVVRGEQDQPVCKAVRRQHPRKGQRCQLPAMFGSDYCQAHDPARELQRQAHLATMRNKTPKAPSLPAGPFIAWLHRLRAESRSWDQVADRVDMHRSQIYKWKDGVSTNHTPLTHVTVERVQRSARAAGTTLEAIYADQAEAIAA